MSTEITDGDVVVSPTRRIRVGSQRLKMARSPTLRFMFFHSAFVAKMSAGELADEDVSDYFDELVTQLRGYNETVDEAAIRDQCSLQDLLSFYGQWFGGAGDDDEAGDERPPQRRGTTGAKRGASKSRSLT